MERENKGRCRKIDGVRERGQKRRVIERQRAEETVGGQSGREYGGGEVEGEGAYVNHSFTSSG